MAKQAKIETKLTGDATGLKRELNTAKSEVTKYARDVTERLRAINAAVQSINVLAQVSAFVGIAKQAIGLYKTLDGWIRGTSEAAQEAAAKAAEAGRKLAEAAGKTSLTPEQFAALTDAAARANIPAAELEKTLAAIAAKGAGMESVAAAVGMTADELERAANVAGRNVTGRKYAALAEARRKEEADAEAGREADRRGYMTMARDLLGASGKDLPRVMADVARAAGGDESAMDYIMSEMIYESRSARGVYRSMLGLDRSVNDVSWRLYGAFSAERERRAQEAAEAEALAAYEKGAEWAAAAKAKAEKEAAERAAAEEKAAAEAAKRDARRGELLEQREAARVKRGEEISALTVSAPPAINGFNSIGGLVGADPTALNMARMESERNAKIEAINKKFDEANDKIQKALDALTGE